MGQPSNRYTVEAEKPAFAESCAGKRVGVAGTDVTDQGKRQKQKESKGSENYLWFLFPPLETGNASR